MIKQRNESYALTAQTVDLLSELCAQALAEAEVDRKDILRIRLSLEEILETWSKDLPEAKTYCRTGHRLGRQHIEIAVEGPHIPDRDYAQAFFLSSRLLTQSGLVPVYSYKDGCNCLRLDPPKKLRVGFLGRIGIAVAAAVVLSALCNLLPAGAVSAVLAVTGPLFDLFAGLLRAVASPLIFLSVCCGILGIGDLSVLGKLGKTVIGRLALGNFQVGIITVLATLWLFPVSFRLQGEAMSGFSEIYQMLLDIVPSDIISPFLDGNALQVIFLGVCVGVALLALGSRVSGIRELLGQLNALVMYFMSAIGKLLPLFIFLSLFNLFLSGLSADVTGIVKIAAITFVGCGVLVAVYIAAVCLKLKIKPALLAKKLLPTFLLALSTASSSAALATSMETCEKRLGIPKNVTSFAIPLGQIVYMPAMVISFLATSLCMAETYQVEITPVWLIAAVVTVGMMAVAAPPVPGGAAGMYTILFAQLGIPGLAVALAVALDSIFDFWVTAVDVVCLQTDLLVALGKTGELDMDTLRAGH